MTWSITSDLPLDRNPSDIWVIIGLSLALPQLLTFEAPEERLLPGSGGGPTDSTPPIRRVSRSLRDKLGRARGLRFESEFLNQLKTAGHQRCSQLHIAR